MESPEDITVKNILAENERRNSLIFARFNPITGDGSTGKRFLAEIDGFPLPKQWLPETMRTVPLVRKLLEAGSVDSFMRDALRIEPNDSDRHKVIDQFVRLRSRHDFAFWAAMYVYIKNKDTEGAPEILFRLTYPQKLFVERLEAARCAGRPIRIVLLKARQWGGSTTSQLYMSWLQLVHKQGLNSLIIAHQGSASDEIKDMFDRMIKSYPVEMLHKPGDKYSPSESKLVGVGHSGGIFRVPQRNCKIKIGTAERPDSCRGGDYALVHLSEVGLWSNTPGKKPEDIVRSACGGVLYRPSTMIVYESTANGVGNFFHREYESARMGRSQFEALFIAWYQIDWNRVPFTSDAERREFTRRLYDGRRNANTISDTEEPGRYLWWLWNKGATLEAINWYILERTKYHDHGAIASECPTDDIEAFVNSGAAVFDRYQVEALKPSCSAPRYVGDIYGTAGEGVKALQSLRFSEDNRGQLWVWSLPDSYNPTDTEVIEHRYLTVVDVGGRSRKSDWSVIVVIDRLPMLDGEAPAITAQWYGHIDIDLLAWKAAQIAAFYDNSLLVIESNTLETHDRTRAVDGDQSHFILNQLADVYPNLYARRQSEEDIRQGIPRKYGFHTNINTKPMIISTLIKMVRERRYVERDERCLHELLTYERKPNGAFGAIDGKHDDLLMTRAIGLHICYYDMQLPQVVTRGRNSMKFTPKIVSSASF